MTVFTILDHIFVTINELTSTIYVHRTFVLCQIAELAQIGDFWPFLASFGVESVTRLIKIFLKYSISLKTVNRSLKCWCIIHTTLIFYGEMGKFLFFEN